MKKRVLASLLAATMLFTSCGNSGSDASTNGTSDSGENVKITMFLSSPEYSDAMNELIDAYEAENPNVTIEYETTQDYNALLKTKINAGETPDMFSTTTGKEIGLYEEYAADLTNEELANVMSDDVKMMNVADDKLLGFSFKNNLFGIVYDVDVLNEVGYSEFPRTMSEFEKLCADLQSAGYQPITTGFAEWWVFKHAFQNYTNAAAESAGISTEELVGKFLNGEAKISDYPELYNDYFKFVELCMKYGDAKPLETDLNTELTNIATKKSPIVVGQGPWVESSILDINPEAKIALAPYPINDNPELAKVIKGPDLSVRINKDSENLQAVLDFCNWWNTSDYAKTWFVDVAGVIPPIKDAPLPELQIVQTGVADADEHGTGAVAISYSTDSFHQTFGELMQSYVGGQMTLDELCTQIEAKWQELG